MKRVSAMSVLSAVFALLVGLVVGGLGPRAEVRDLEKKLAEAEECSGSTMGSEIANVFRGRPWEEGTARPKVVQSADPEPAPEVEPEVEPEEPSNGITISFGDKDEDLSQDDISDSLDLAREAMELRYAQSREALIQGADPSDEQMAEIDTVMDTMNEELVGLARELTEVMSSGEEPGRRETMEFAADTLDVLLAAEDGLRGALNEDQMAGLQAESLDPMAYVDPTIVDILSELNR